MASTHHPYGDRAARHAAQLTERTREENRASTGGALLPSPMGALAVALLGLWTFLASPVLDTPYTGVGWDTALHDELVSVPIILAGLVLLRRPASTTAAVIAVLAGLTLATFGLWADHDAQRMAVNEIATGFAVVVSALIARLSLARARR
jgi:hypothetical protein